MDKNSTQRSTLYQILLTSALTVTSLYAFSQEVIKGKISNNGLPLSSVTVKNISNNTSTKSLEDGSFNIPASSGINKLVVSYIGFTTQTKEITISQGIEGLVNFELSSVSLDEVVVIGSRAQGRSNLQTSPL